MSTYEPLIQPSASSGFSLHARGCVLMEEQTVDESEQQTAKIKQDAEAEARKRYQREIEALRKSQQQLWNRLQQEMGKTMQAMEADIKHQLIHMSVRIAEIILGRELPDAEMVRSVLDDVLSPISDLQGVRVRVAPGTMDLLAGGATSMRSGLQIVEDPELKKGDVLVESRNGIFDGRLKSRLEHLAEALTASPADESPLNG